jgi:RNA polymerase sigma factor (sigma-70 family)
MEAMMTDVDFRDNRCTPTGMGGDVGNPDVSDLLAAAAAGSQVAWNEIVSRYTNLLWAIGRTHRLDTATINDVIQTTWLRLIENLGRIHDPTRLAGWLATTARRECLSVLRRSGREVVTWDVGLIADLDDTAPPVEYALLLDERDAVLWASFRNLSESCQRFLRVLTSVDRSSYVEVAAAFGVPIGSIGPTRMRCLTRLRELLRDTGYAFDGR